MEQTVVLMCGIPGSGKSTYIKSVLSDYPGGWVSRDAIRKGLVGECEAGDTATYFSQEDEVFEEFVADINYCLHETHDQYVYVDATHISPASRKKVLSRIEGRENLNLEVVVFDVPVNVAQARNLNRTGFARVPRSAIYNMAKGFKMPTEEELAQFKFKSVNIKGV